MAEATSSAESRQLPDEATIESELINSMTDIEDQNIEMKHILIAAETLAWRIKDSKNVKITREISALSGLMLIMQNRTIEISGLIEKALSAYDH